MAENLILKEILKKLPDDSITDAGFEGANIVLYTNDKDLLFEGMSIIRELVSEFKKRIEIRPDPEMCKDKEETKKIIMDIFPEEAGVSEIIFDPQRSQVIIHAEKPGVAIGKQGSTLREIKEKTFWVAEVKRTPPLRSQLLENIRNVLYEHSDYRRKFLNKVGHRIYDGWIRGKKDEWVRLTFLGAGRQVGRSALLVQTPESRVLLDCGINVASDDEPYPYLESPEFRIEELDAVVLSHAHADHSALIPYLFKFGYRGPVYCTAPTRDISALIQLDSVKIQKNEGKKELYDVEDVKEFVKHCIILDWKEVTDITPDVRLTFYNSGHILGSSQVHLHIGNGLHNFVYTADMKLRKTLLLPGADTKFPRCESMLVEATYGGKDSVTEDIMELNQHFQEIVKKTFARGGKILVPTLGSGRAQEVIIFVVKLIESGEIDPVPIYVDGMCWDITAIYTAYPEFLNADVRKEIFHRDNNPFLNENVKHVGSQKERRQIIESGDACIIIATSGMLIGGPSVQYLGAMAEDDRNTLVFSCYQGEGSLGAKIRRGEKQVVLGYEKSGRPDVLTINMEISKIEISGHADRHELLEYVKKCSPRPRRILVNHGDQGRCLDLASTIHKQFRVETQAPRNLETVRLR